MAEKGFAIRCPYCGNWDVRENENPKDFAVKVRDIPCIMAGFREASERQCVDAFLSKNKKLFRCTQPTAQCPASFEALIFDNEQKALLSLETIGEKWQISRDFRLYKADKKRRWEGKYYVIMFGTEPVRRLQDIELEHLLDRRLMSKILTGICQEIRGPGNIYSANVIKGTPPEDLYWMPIEHYEDENSLIPNRFNIFCETCRRLTIGRLERELIRLFRKNIAEKRNSTSDASERKKLDDIYAQLRTEIDLSVLPIDPEFCPFKNPKTHTKYWDQEAQKCAGRDPVCRRTGGNETVIDLNHCPAFIDLRRKFCLCYSSDMRLLEKIKGTWEEETSLGPSECPADFIEMGMPIIVHEHLLGVMMIGQMFKKDRPIVPIEGFMKNVAMRTPHSLILPRGNDTAEEQIRKRSLHEELAKARHVMLWLEEKATEEDERFGRAPRTKKARFLVSDSDIAYRVEALRKNVEGIQRVAEARYRDLRSRSEQAFRDEILGYVYHKMMEQQRGAKFDFFSGQDAPIIHVLGRMIDFWAFEAVAYLWRDTNDAVYLTAYAADKPSDVGEAFGFIELHEIGKVKVDKFQEHPVCWLFDREHDKRPPKNAVIMQLYQCLLDSESTLKEFGVPTDGCYFFVVVPFEGVVHALIFAKRKQGLLSRTVAKKSFAVSELCREFMLRTCFEVVCELCDVRYRQNHK